MKELRFERMDEFFATSFPLAGDFDTPVLAPVEDVPDGLQWQAFDDAMKGVTPCDAVHFYCYDYKFEKIWTHPKRYADALRKYQVVVAPDFSMYSDLPRDDRTPDYRLGWRGQPFSVVTVSTTMTQKNKIDQIAFRYGYDAMLEWLCPSKIILFGIVPDGLRGNIVNVPPRWRSMVERRLRAKEMAAC